MVTLVTVNIRQVSTSFFLKKYTTTKYSSCSLFSEIIHTCNYWH